LLSLGDFRAPTFSLSVTRGDVGLEDEFELFMQLLGTYFNLFTLLVLACDAGSHEYEHRQCRLYRDAKTRQLPRSVLYSMLCNEYRMMGGPIQSIVETAIGACPYRSRATACFGVTQRPMRGARRGFSAHAKAEQHPDTVRGVARAALRGWRPWAGRKGRLPF
jgi:hypothetical protein